MASISHVDGLAKATSTMAGGLPKEDSLYKETLGNLMQQTDQRIVGGGVWFDPNMYSEGRERQSFVWGRDVSGDMQPLDRYNQVDQTPNPYYREWWYIPAMYARHDHCVWRMSR
ncbi:hypothetical protein ACT3QO_12720 [Psychrobacter sp. AOP7-D1-15]|nr:hypothetical protein [Psychrobacter sp. FME61]